MVIIGFVGGLVQDGPESRPTPVGSPDSTPTAGAAIGTEEIGVGDCLILPSEDEFDEVRRLPCSDPHDGEVLLVEDHPESDYPSDAAFESWVDAECVPAFAAYTGSAFDEQEVLDLGWFTPTQVAWEAGSRGVTCYLTPANGIRTTVSYRNANP